MDPKTETRLSKFLSLVLRHEPGKIGLTLDEAGWTDLDLLASQAQAHGTPLTRELVEAIVANNAKQRFALGEDGRRIRANQGHSVEVDLAAHLAAIRAEGFKKMERHHVHLSPDFATAEVVGKRRGQPMVLAVAAGRMAADGFVFYCSANGVWLTEAVPASYIAFPGQ